MAALNQDGRLSNRLARWARGARRVAVVTLSAVGIFAFPVVVFDVYDRLVGWLVGWGNVLGPSQEPWATTLDRWFMRSWAIGSILYLAMFTSGAILVLMARYRAVTPRLEVVAGKVYRMMAWFSPVAVVLLLAAVGAMLWWDLWMVHGWPGPPELLSPIETSDGEGACTRVELEMACVLLLFLGVVWLSNRIGLRWRVRDQVRGT